MNKSKTIKPAKPLMVMTAVCGALALAVFVGGCSKKGGTQEAAPPVAAQ